MTDCTCQRNALLYLRGHVRGCPMWKPPLRPLREKPLIEQRRTFVGKRRDRRRPSKPRG